MQVKQVDGLEPKVLARAVDLIAQVIGRHAMHAAHYFFRIDDPAFDIFPHKVTPGISREIAVEREVARLGGDENLIPRNLSASNQRG